MATRGASASESAPPANQPSRVKIIRVFICTAGTSGLWRWATTLIPEAQNRDPPRRPGSPGEQCFVTPRLQRIAHLPALQAEAAVDAGWAVPEPAVGVSTGPTLAMIAELVRPAQEHLAVPADQVRRAPGSCMPRLPRRPPLACHRVRSICSWCGGGPLGVAQRPVGAHAIHGVRGEVARVEAGSIPSVVRHRPADAAPGVAAGPSAPGRTRRSPAGRSSTGGASLPRHSPSRCRGGTGRRPGPPPATRPGPGVANMTEPPAPEPTITRSISSSSANRHRVPARLQWWSVCRHWAAARPLVRPRTPCLFQLRRGPIAARSRTGSSDGCTSLTSNGSSLPTPAFC